MKKLLFLLSIFTFGLNAQAQCTVDATNNDALSVPAGTTMSGDTAFLPTLSSGNYEAVFQLAIPASVQVLNITSVKVKGINGLPAGLTYACDQADCVILGGAKGCIVIQGTANSGVNKNSQYELKLDLEAVTNLGTFTYDQLKSQLTEFPGTIIMKTDDKVSVDEYEIATETTVFPNPSEDGHIRLRYQSKESSRINYMIMDAAGRIVMTKVATNQEGENNVDFDLSGVASGLYILNVSNGKGSFNKEIVIQ
ncbi:MAG: T9SS type A sorting domain-containing protein [Flavobacteriales bacterium]|jgi:hypothetical protein|nr:T9SS type A sorting domain-containing protein [Flavobacteriales bacterium]